MAHVLGRNSYYTHFLYHIFSSLCQIMTNNELSLQVYSVGRGDMGRLGLGNTDSFYTPQLVTALNNHKASLSLVDPSVANGTHLFLLKTLPVVSLNFVLSFLLISIVSCRFLSGC